MAKKIIISCIFYTLLLTIFTLDAGGDDIEQWFSAAEKGDLNTVKKLLNKIDVNAQDINGDTALNLAASFGHENIVKVLLKTSGIDINFQDKEGSTALMYAAAGDQENISILLLQAGINVNAHDKYGKTALMFAAFEGNENIVKRLLQIREININAQDDELETALIYAVRGNHKNIVKLLLNAGADPNIKNKEGKTAPELAKLKDWFEAAEKNYIGTIQKLVGKVDVNAKDEQGYTALMHAVANEHENIVKLLLQTPDINVNTQDDDGLTPLMDASSLGNKAIVKLLLDAGADSNIKNKKGQTAFSYAGTAFIPTLKALINETKIIKNQPRLLSGLSTELHLLSKV